MITVVKSSNDSIIDKINNTKMNYKDDFDRVKIIDSYVSYYQFMPILFTHSNHIFDEEPEIQKELLKQGKYKIQQKEVDNYIFVESVNDRMVQISDVMVSLLSKFLIYIKGFEVGDNTLNSLAELRKSLSNQTQRTNFCLLMKKREQ